MKTLYLRNVPDDVVDRLQKLALQAGMSVNAFAVRELAAQSRRADNAALLESLPDLSIDGDEVVAGLRMDRDNH